MSTNQSGQDQQPTPGEEPPAKRHGDPLFDATSGNSDAREGSRHGFDVIEESRRERQDVEGAMNP